MGRRATTILALAGLLACAPAAGAASLPRVSSGQRPGPPLLYEKNPSAPQLSLQVPFAAQPLLVSASDAYRAGEYLYQDYLFDDRGANTVPGRGSRGDPSSDIAAATAGDVQYPTDGERYAGNAADIVEFRVKPTPDAIVYRVTLNTVKAADAAVVGIGIDSDRSGGAGVAWPLGAGISSPGLDRFITAYGSGGKVSNCGGVACDGGADLPAGSVSIDQGTNQMTIRVPRSVMDPGGATWRYVTGAGLWNGSAWKPVPTSSSATASESASGSALRGAPAVFNLGFRFDEPQTAKPLLPYDTFPGIGNWFEDKQANALAGGTSGDFHADIDFAKLAANASEQLHSPPGREQARIMSSKLNLSEGVGTSFPAYGGALQPYILTVPPGYDGSKPVGLTFALHSLGGTYTQFAVFSPNQLRQFGDQRNNIVATPLARGTNGWYTDEAEADVFEVWRDVAARFKLDSEKVSLSGYSMGGYGTYKLGTHYPDLFGKAYTTVGPPARETWVPPSDPVIVSEGGKPNESSNSNLVLENARWVPFLNWVEVTDELVPYVGPRAQQARFDALGLRSQLWSFTPGEHFTLAVLDGWDKARDFLGSGAVTRDPWRVNYAFVPAADRAKLGLAHDHAYWVSGLRARVTNGDPGTDPSRGEVNARSLAFGQRDPGTRRVTSAAGGQSPPQLNAVEGTEWTGTPGAAKSNELLLSLDNTSRATIAGSRARLTCRRPLRVELASDGGGRVRLNLPVPRGASVQRVKGPDLKGRDVALDSRGATFAVARGTRAYRICASTAAADGGGGSGGDGGAGAAANASAGGSLPFTGLNLLPLLLLGAGMLLSGGLLRRGSG